MTSRKPRFFSLLLLVFGLAVAVSLVPRATHTKISATQTPLANWKELILHWPVANPDNLEFYLQPNGDLAQLLIKGDTYYFRYNPQAPNWFTGKILTEQNQTTYPFPTPIAIDSIAMFYKKDDLGTTYLYQTVTKGSIWWTHKNGQAWTSAGNFATGETTTCPPPFDKLPASVNTMTTFPYTYNGKSTLGVTITKDGKFWSKPDSMSKIYIWCGYPVTGYSGPFTGHTAFQLNAGSPTSELFTNGSTYWFFPDVNDRGTVISGVIPPTAANIAFPVSESSGLVLNPNSVSTTISPNIFGVSLVWHPPYAPDPAKIIAEPNNPIRKLGFSILRFPGGCGGDAYDALHPANVTAQNGITLDKFISILTNTNSKPLYTFNLEGTDSHANTNCHWLTDYPGNVGDVPAIVSYMTGHGQPLVAAETGNEPWAKSNYSNWNETWSAGEYANTITGLPVLPNLIAATSPSIDINTGRSPWEDSVRDAMRAANKPVGFYQLHPYTWTNNADQEPDFALTQVNATAKAIDDMRSSRGYQPGITEYNLYCWDGIGSVTKNLSAGGLGQALYLAQHLVLFAQKNIQYAAYWNLFDGYYPDGRPSTWRCGLVKETSPGVYSLTPAGSAFSLLSFLKNQQITASAYSGTTLTTLSTKYNGKISTVLINPSPATVKIVYKPSVSFTSATVSSLYPSPSNLCNVSDNKGLLFTCLSGSSSTSTSTVPASGNILNLELKPFSVYTVRVN